MTEIPNAHGCLEYAQMHGVSLVLRGWMVDAEGPFEELEVSACGQHLERVEKIDRPDLISAVTTIPNCQNSGFHIEVPQDLLDARGRVQVTISGLRCGIPVARMRVGWMRSAERVPVPPVHLSFRVAHTDLGYLYKAGGVKTAFDYHRVAARHGLASAERVLDWGCGPGRVTAHLRELFHGAELHGADIDHEAILWASANLPGVKFVPAGLEPPLPFDDGSFDLITAGSVFTHLTHDLQQAWLLELRRLLAPGGRALVSTLGGFAARMRCTDLELLSRLERNGFDDATRDSSLQGVAPEGYYRATWQTIDWTMSQWATFIDLVEVEEGGYENYQDLWTLAR